MISAAAVSSSDISTALLCATFAGQNLVIASRAGLISFDRSGPPPGAERL